MGHHCGVGFDLVRRGGLYPSTLVNYPHYYPSLHTYRYDWTKTLWLDAGRCPGRWTDVRRTLKNTFPLTSTWPRSLLNDHLGLVMRAKLLHMHHVRLFTGCISLVWALCFPVPQDPHSLQCVRLMRPKSSSLAPLPPPLRPPREANLCHQTLTARNLLTFAFACH
jgi:hypothetical protein